MSVLDEQGRPEPPVSGDEVTTLLGFLDYQRATFAWKCAGLDADGFGVSVAASTMTLGGMLKHLALVERSWFTRDLHGRPRGTPWDGVDWTSDPDWEWHSAAQDSPDQLRGLWRAAVERSRADASEALADGGLDRLAVRAGRTAGRPASGGSSAT